MMGKTEKNNAAKNLAGIVSSTSNPRSPPASSAQGATSAATLVGNCFSATGMAVVDEEFVAAFEKQTRELCEQLRRESFILPPSGAGISEVGHLPPVDSAVASGDVAAPPPASSSAAPTPAGASSTAGRATFSNNGPLVGGLAGPLVGGRERRLMKVGGTCAHKRLSRLSGFDSDQFSRLGLADPGNRTADRAQESPDRAKYLSLTDSNGLESGRQSPV